MGNYPRFLISTNKKAAPGKVFLVHAKSPRFIGELLTFHSLSDFQKFNANPPKELLCYIKGEKRILSTHFNYAGKIAGLFVLEFEDIKNSTEEKRLDGLMKKSSRLAGKLF